jgi:hypothetical protein
LPSGAAPVASSPSVKSAGSWRLAEKVSDEGFVVQRLPSQCSHSSVSVLAVACAMSRAAWSTCAAVASAWASREGRRERLRFQICIRPPSGKSRQVPSAPPSTQTPSGAGIYGCRVDTLEKTKHLMRGLMVDWDQRAVIEMRHIGEPGFPHIGQQEIAKPSSNLAFQSDGVVIEEPSQGPVCRLCTDYQVARLKSIKLVVDIASAWAGAAPGLPSHRSSK